MRDNIPHRVKSVTAFKLLHRFSQGENIEPFLKVYSRSNELRILSSTDGPNTPWGNDAWPLPSKTMVREFCEYVGERNWDVEFTCITGNDDSKITALRNIIEYLGFKKVKNVVIELANEPQFNKSDPHLLEEVAKNSGLLWSSGIYHDNNQFFGQFINYHPARDSEWVRKFHDALEYWQGGGPSFAEERALKVPSKADELIRPDQTNFNQLDFYTYGAGVGLFSAGGCFHSQSGKLANLPSQVELDCYNAFMNGMELFPPDAVLGNYNRPVEHSLRTYTVGRFMIRVRPNGDNPFSDVYDVPLDKFNICYSLDPITVPSDPPTNEVDNEMPKYTYDEMMVLVNDMNAVTKTTKLAQLPVVKDLDMYPVRTTAHLLWKWFFENATSAQILEETRKRGNNEPV